MLQTSGIHHVTAIAGAPQENLDFYTDVLGLRLVKLTVNYDDPGTYHFYFGDALGSPGTILTFFPWPSASPGRPGPGQAIATSYAINPDSVEYWLERLGVAGVPSYGPQERFGEQVIDFADPHGLKLELVTVEGHRTEHVWNGSPVPADHQMGFFHSVTLCVHDRSATAAVLELLGYRRDGEEGARWRFRAPGEGGNGEGRVVDLIERKDSLPGRILAGSVHHVAFRVADEETQLAVRKELVAHGFNVSMVMDRSYFRSIYFREPGGVLFEIATDVPGFAVDEPVDALGETLRLPKRLEPSRHIIEQSLPSLRMPKARA